MNRLQGKDFINIGIFTAIYFVIIFAVGMIGFIPIFIPLISVLVPLIGGIPMMLYFSKIKKFGMLTITGVLVGLLMLLTGMGYWCIFTGFLFGLIADFMLKAANYKKAWSEILTYGVYSVWTVGAFIPIIVTRDAYYEKLLSGFGQEYADTLMGYMPDWILPVLAIACFVSGIAGGVIGRKIFKKHFERAGIV
ncbi:MAG: MptD family putative ECF transporter S component [Muricomes sp.]